MPSTGTFSIGTNSRDYSTISAWEADTDVSLTGDVVGECYNDSVFDEQFDIGGATSTSSTQNRTLTVASGERHDGTAGTGARINYTSPSDGGKVFSITEDWGGIEWLEITVSDLPSGTGSFRIGEFFFNTDIRVHRLIIHDMSVGGSGGEIRALSMVEIGVTLTNCVIYDLSADTVYGPWLEPRDNSFTLNVHNNTVEGLQDGSSDSSGYEVRVESSDTLNIKNSVAFGTPGSDFSWSTTTGTINSENNASGDGTADDQGGTGHLINQTASNWFQNLTDGSEDYHLQSSANGVDAGTDLGDVPAKIDIDGFDRHADGGAWDIGADEGVFAITLSPGVATSTANALASTLDPGSLTLSAGTSTATANALATDLNHVLQTGVATATANALAETLSATGTVTLSAGTSTATANALAGSISIVLNTGLPSATANALAETLSATGVVALSPGTATSTGAALPSDLSGTGVVTLSAGVSSASSTGLQAALNHTLHPNTASSTGNALDPSLDATGTVTLSAGLVTATANVLTPDRFAVVVVLTPGAASATASGLNSDMFAVGAASDMKPGIASATSSGLRAKFIEKIVRLWTASPPTGVIQPQNVGRPEMFDGARNKFAHSGAMQSRNRTQAGFQWTEEYGLLRMGDEGTEELMAIIEDIYSTENILKTTHPTTPGSGIDPNGTGTSGVTVNGASQKGDSIATTGWPVSTSDVVVAGDVIKIDGFDRVFRITSNADSDVNGNATLDINPPIYESPVDGASVTTTEVEFEVNVVGVDNWPSVGDFYYDGMQVTFREQLDS